MRSLVLTSATVAIVLSGPVSAQTGTTLGDTQPRPPAASGTLPAGPAPTDPAAVAAGGPDRVAPTPAPQPTLRIPADQTVGTTTHPRAPH